MRWFFHLLGLFFWIRTFSGFAVAGFLLGLVAQHYIGGIAGDAIYCLVIAAGIYVGVYFAEKERKKISDATPDENS